ncbi:MAG: hypothetical protein J6J44_05010 [Lachnospiraceae bacterium]|nr:hypothetical protein [Lachnospiraceae bacterium]
MQDFCILKQEELLILASAFHLKQVYGLSYEKTEERLIPYQIHEMTRSGILQPQNGKLNVSMFYRRIFQILCSAKYVLSVHKRQREGKICWYYIGDEVVCMEESLADKGSLRISICSKEGLYTVLTEQGLLPESLLDAELAKLENYKEVEAKMVCFPVCYQYRLLCVENEMVQAEKWFNLIRTDHNYWVIEQRLSGNRLLRYSPEDFFQRIISMSEEEVII